MITFEKLEYLYCYFKLLYPCWTGFKIEPDPCLEENYPHNMTLTLVSP